MTKSNPIQQEELPPYLMILSFDVHQMTSALKYRFRLPNGDPKGPVPDGPLTGSYHFQKNDRIQVAVEARSIGKDSVINMQNIDCTFVYVGTENSRGSEQDLSPFSEETACFSLMNEEWHKVKPVLYQGDDLVTVTHFAEPIHPVEAKEGMWAMSGYLSVKYQIEEGGDSRYRLFSFDPETSAGSGGPGPQVAGYPKR